MSSNFLADIVDPGNFFHDTRSERLADKQWEWQKEKYDENFKFQQEQYRYQQLLNDMQMEREDNAVQRRVADLKAAGLSPTLAAGSPASATPVHASSAPQYEVGTNPKLEAAMFKEGLMKDRLALAMTLMGNIADVSRTKAETELIKAQKGHQDIINKYEDDVLSEKVSGMRLSNIAQNMANNFARLSNPAKLEELRLTIKKAKQEIDVGELNKKIMTHEHLRQIYYDMKAKFEAALASENVEIAKLRRENIDWDTMLKIYAYEYASDRSVPLSGNLGLVGGVADAAALLWHWVHGK